MRTYAISPDLFKRNTFNDEYEDWMFGCFKSKWDNNSSSTIEDELEEESEVFDPNILKQD
jgi:hypothetical protein